MGCNGWLVGKGDSPVSLLQKCGEPIYRQSVCVPMLQLGWVVTPYRGGGPAAILANQCVPMEEWTYDRGQGAFFGIVRIYNGTIESVATATDKRHTTGEAEQGLLRVPYVPDRQRSSAE